NRNDVRVIERRSGPGFKYEAAYLVQVAGDLGGKYLDSHFTLKTLINGQIHLPHPARAEGRNDLVLGDSSSRPRADGCTAHAGTCSVAHCKRVWSRNSVIRMKSSTCIEPKLKKLA